MYKGVILTIISVVAGNSFSFTSKTIPCFTAYFEFKKANQNAHLYEERDVSTGVFVRMQLLNFNKIGVGCEFSGSHMQGVQRANFILEPINQTPEKAVYTITFKPRRIIKDPVKELLYPFLIAKVKTSMSKKSGVTEEQVLKAVAFIAKNARIEVQMPCP